MRKILFIIPLFFVNCGDIAPQSPSSKPTIDKYLIIQPTNPPFISFSDNNIGTVDKNIDVKFPSKPIPSVPNII